ncbi:MAG: Peptidase M23B [Candidatus Woesebacteria bacterium GW2011_GWB1_38_5b]|uniref:Peptidase M23B n=1 Tax=Candidatus Woesebacteria bacterium GW2011_GWB1_38_5b TaxID=1618569 RepID=A0A0G0K7K2_9BACT|nr:MAG: Peptidase M23B [Candidatus Woesebacteria bacterium GW2011_GWB1_38_5b]
MTLSIPVPDPVITQPFGQDNTNHHLRKNFYALFDNLHPGIDFGCPIGIKVYASYNGIVVRKEFHKGMGNVIGTRHGNIIILYAHLSKFSVEMADKIKKGQLIGLSGDTGEAYTEPHLHFEVRDLTKNQLKDMVFKPEFDKNLKQFKKEFIYQVNNANTQKTPIFLAKRYFGDSKYWRKILDINPNLSKNPDKIIDNASKIIIPNY